LFYRKVCVLAPRFPYPENGGDVVLINDIMQYFKDIGYDVILLSYYEQGQVCYISRHYKNIDKIIAIKRNKFSSFFYSLFFFLLRKPIQCGYYFSKKMQQALSLVNEKYCPDLYVCHLLRMLPHFEALGIRENVIVQMTDILSDTYSLSKAANRSLMKKLIYKLERLPMKRYEDYVVHTYPKVVLVSEKDKNRYCNIPSVCCHNNGIREVMIADRVDTNKIVFVGNMRTLQNIDACIYFINRIFPKILLKNSSVILHIVGADPSRAIFNLQNTNIKVTGYVENVTKYIQDAVVSVAPIRVASGIQNKVLISMAAHVPVVLSSLISGGVPELINKVNCFIEDDPDIFAQRVVDLMSNPKMRNDFADKAMDIVNFTGAEYMKSNVDFSWKGLPDIYVIFGSHEVLLAELDEAKQKAASENVVMRAYIGEGMMHTWAAAGFLPESRHVRSKIYSIIRQDSELKWENA